MTSLIKFDTADGQERIRALHFTNAPSDTAPHVQEDPAIVALKTEIAELRAVIEELNDTHVAAISTAREEGRKAAEAVFVRDQAKALAVLKDGMREAHTTLQDHLGAAEKLAILFSATALEMVIGDTREYHNLIAECVRLQVEGLRRETILGVRVSTADFADQTATDTLASELQLKPESIARDPSLPAGHCRIELRLGAIDIALPEHWAALQALCQHLVNGGVTP